MSSSRQTWRASAEMTVSGRSAARASASAVFPDAVGPTTTIVLADSAPAKTPLHLVRRQLDDGRPTMDVVRREGGREQAVNQLAHFLGVQPVSRLDGGPARERRCEPLQPVLPPAETPSRQVADELLQAPLGLEARVRVGRGVRDQRAPGE